MKTRLNPFFRHGILVSSLAFCLGQAAGAADILWNGALTGTLDWNTGGNWTGGSFVNSTTDRADLRADWASTPTINLSAPVTVNGILFNDTGSSGDTTLSLGNGGTAGNTLTLGGSSPSIDVLSTTLTISANLVGSSGFAKSSGGVLVLSGSNTALSGPVIVSGGTLRLGGTSALNSGTSVQLNAGATLQVNSSNTIAGLNDNAGAGGSVTNSSGGGKVLTIGGSGSYSFIGSFSGNITGTKVGLVVSGTGTQILGGDNTANIGYQSVTGNGGTLVFAKQNSIFQGLSAGAVVNSNTAANAGINVSLGGTVALGVGDSAGGYFDATAIATFLDGTHMGASSSTTGFRNSSIFGLDTTNATGGSFTYSTALTNIGTSTGIGFAKLGAGTLVLDAANTYGGVTQVRAGTLQLGSGGTSGSIGSSADVTVSSGAALAFNRSDNALTVANMITGEGSVVQRGSGMTTLSSSASNYSGGTSITGGTLRANNAAAIGTGTVTFSGSGGQLKLNTAGTISNGILISGGAGISGQGMIDTDTAIHGTISGAITIDASPSISGAGHFGSSSAGSLTVSGVITSAVPVVWRRNTGIFSGGGTGYSALQIRSGSVRIGGDNGLATTATVAIGGDGAAILDLAGYNQSLVGITKGVNAATITNSGSSDSTLTITGTSTYAGVIQDGATNKVALHVNGGSLTLSAANTYTGATTVSSGTLYVNGSLHADSVVSVSENAIISGTGLINGDLTLASGAILNITDLNDALSVGGTISFGGFGFGNITGWDYENAAPGTYTLLSGNVDFANVSNVGLDNALTLLNGNKAYFQNGSLQVVVIPEPRAALIGGLGMLFLLRRRRL